MAKRLLRLGFYALIVALIALCTIGIYDSLSGARDDKVAYSNEAGVDVYRVQSDGSVYSAGNLVAVGGIKYNYKAITTTTTVTVSDSGFLNVTGGTCGINLPTAVGNAGVWYSVKHSTTNAIVVTIDPNGSETIDGAATNTSMDAANDTLGFYSDGANWKIFMRYIQ